MGTWMEAIFTLLFGWVRALANMIWDVFTTDRTTLLEWLGKYWIPLTVTLVAVGLVGDWLVWLICWQPRHRVAVKAKKVLHIEDDRPSRPRKEDDSDWLPLERESAEARARRIPDEELGRYPGRAYRNQDRPGEETRILTFPGAGEAVDEEDWSANRTRVDDRTRALHPLPVSMPESAKRVPGTGAGQTSVPRTEDQTRKLTLQESHVMRRSGPLTGEETRRMDRAQTAPQAGEDQTRRVPLSSPAAKSGTVTGSGTRSSAPAAAKAQTSVREETPQERYEREMEEYRIKKAEYDRQMEEYRRKKAEYDKKVAEIPKRRPVQARTGSGHPQAAPTREHPAAEKKGIMHALGNFIGDEEEDRIQRTSLPPRVDVKDAYRPATLPRRRTGDQDR